MKKSILLAIVVLSALSLLQCQYMKRILDDLNTTIEEENEISSSSYKTEKSSSSEAKKTRKEVR